MLKIINKNTILYIMKNLANYLDDYLDEENGLVESVRYTKHNNAIKNICKENRDFERETKNQVFHSNHSSHRHKKDYVRKQKYKN